MSQRFACLLLAVATMGGATLAQTANSTPRHAAADAAGSLALHLCTGYFATEAPRSLVLDLIPTVALPIAPATSRTEVDEQAKTVSVHYADDMPPRVAVQRRRAGLHAAADRREQGGGGRAAETRRQRLRTSTTGPGRWATGTRCGTLPASRQAAVEKVLDEAFKNESGRLPRQHLGRRGGEGRQDRRRALSTAAWARTSPARTNSMCKTIGGSLVGIGVHKGLLDVNRKAPLAEWRRPGDPRGEITLDHLMHMASGLYTEGSGGNPQARPLSVGRRRRPRSRP